MVLSFLRRSFFLLLTPLLLVCGCKRKCWQCVRPDSGEPIFEKLCNDAPDYNRQALDSYKYACQTVSGVIREVE